MGSIEGAYSDLKLKIYKIKLSKQTRSKLNPRKNTNELNSIQARKKLYRQIKFPHLDR